MLRCRLLLWLGLWLAESQTASWRSTSPKDVRSLLLRLLLSLLLLRLRTKETALLRLLWLLVLWLCLLLRLTKRETTGSGSPSERIGISSLWLCGLLLRLSTEETALLLRLILLRLTEIETTICTKRIRILLLLLLLLITTKRI